MGLRTGSSTAERGAWPRSLRGTIVAGPTPSRAHDNDCLCLPAASTSHQSEAGKKESPDHHLNPACQPCAEPSSISSFDCRLINARTADNGSAQNGSTNKSAKVVLARQRIPGLCRFPKDLENHGEEGGRPSRLGTSRLAPQDDGRPTNHAARIVLLPSSNPRIGWPARRTRRWGGPRMYKPFAWLAALAAIGFAAPASAQTELQWWHAMAGELGQKIEKLATDFNNSQKDFKVVPVYKGTYPEVMTGAIAAFRAKQPPHIIQVFEVGTATMMAARGAVYPVYELMKDAGEPFDPKAYLPAVVGYYTDTQGNMLSFPFNSSTPVLYYNKDLFKKAGLDPNSPPKTWPEVGAAAAKLQAAGVPCGFTSEWPSWINIENLSAWHNVPIAT